MTFVNTAPSLVGTVRRLLHTGGALHSVDGGELLEREALQDALVERLCKIQPAAPAALASFAREILDSVEASLNRDPAAAAEALSGTELDNLEVIVQVVGRPALRVLEYNGLETPSGFGGNEHWATVFNAKCGAAIRVRDGIIEAAHSVAKVIMVPGTGREQHLGTGWRLGDDLLVTNRHVARLMVSDPTAPHAHWQLNADRVFIARFNVADRTDNESPCTIAALMFCAGAAELDVAVLRLRPSGQVLPKSLRVSFDPQRLGRPRPGSEAGFEEQQIYVVGHPLARLPTPATTSVFVDADGSKRCAPGLIKSLRHDVPWLLHDCSTLGGNSGSPVMDLYGHQVVGIHFGGQAEDALQTTGPFNAAVAPALLGDQLLRDILASGKVST
jgi:hypothetical protein